MISDTFVKIGYNISIRTLGGVPMSNVSVLLSKQEQDELLSQLEEFVVLGSQAKQITKEVKEVRFSKGRVCCHCNGTNVVRNGKNNGVQRYLCKCCNKSFSDLTSSATYRSKKD